MTVGVVGLGTMGGGMARALCAAGWDVIGYDIDPARVREFDVRPADSLTQVAAEAGLALVSVNTGEQLLAIAGELRDRLVIDASTIDVEHSHERAAELGLGDRDHTVIAELLVDNR